MAVRRIDEPKPRPAPRPVAPKPILPPPPTGHSPRSTLTADAAARARRANLTGQAAPTVKTPEVLKGELASLDKTIAKKSLAPGIRNELRQERVEKLAEYKRTLQQSITNLEQVSKRFGGEDAAAVRKQLEGYRADLAALTPTSATSAATATSSTTSVDQAKAKVEQAYESGGPKAAMVELEKQTLAMTPDDATRLVAATKPIIDEVAKDLMKGDSADREQALTSLTHALSRATPEATTQVAKQIADQVVDTGFDARIGNLDNGLSAALSAGAGSGLGFALTKELAAQGKVVAAAKVEKAVTKGIEGPMKAFNEAQQKYLERDTQLAQDLSQFGPGMTPEQRQKYVDAFWADPKNKEVKDAYEKAERDFATSFGHDRAGLEAAAAAGDKKAAELLMKGVETLAQTPNHAKEAIDFVDQLGRPENKALFDALNKDGKLEDRLADDVLAPAIGNAQSKALIDGSMDDLVAQLKSIQKLGKNFSKLPGQIKDAVATVDKVSELLAKGLKGPELMAELRLQNITDGWDQKSKLGKALAIFTVVGAIKRAGDTDGLDQLEASLTAVKGGLELTAGILGTLGRAGKLAGGAEGAKLIAKYLPGVAFAIDGVQLAQDIQKLRNGGNAGDVIATVGTVVNLVGDVAGVVPILGTAVDGVLGTVGTILQGIGGLVSGFITGNEEREKRAADRDKYLTAAGVSAHDRDVLLTGGFIDNAALGTMGLSREQFLGALEAMQKLPDNDEGKSAYAAIIAWDAAATYGLQGADAVKFVEQMQKAVVNMSWGELDQLQRALNDLSYLAQGANHDGLSDAETRKAIEERLDLVDWVMERNAPEIYEQWKLEDRDASDVNLPFFSTYDQR